MQHEKIPPNLRKSVKEFVDAHEKGREASNAANRLKTELRNTIKSVWTTMELPIGSFIRTGGMEFRYEANESTEINNEPILEMFLKEEITREQFLRMFKVDSKEAKNILGADQVADLEVKTVGDKLDVRIENLPVEKGEDDYIAVASVIKTNRKRRVFGSGTKPTKVAAPVEQSPRKRFIKVKGKK